MYSPLASCRQTVAVVMKPHECGVQRKIHRRKAAGRVYGVCAYSMYEEEAEARVNSNPSDTIVVGVPELSPRQGSECSCSPSEGIQSYQE